MPDIALVYPYSYRQAHGTMLFHPLGIAQLSSILKRQGMESFVIDLTFSEPGSALAALLEARPKIVGIYAMLTMIESALALAAEIRNVLPEALLACGGPMPTLRPEQFAGHFDVIFRGEAACSFPRFCRDYLGPGELKDLLKVPSRYPGIYARNPENGEILEESVQSLSEEELDALPIPDRQGFRHDLYQRFWQERKGFKPAGVMTTYGCPYSCSFCSKPVFGNRFRRRHMDRIMDEVRDIVSLGYDGLWIADDCFTLDLDHVRSFCRAMISRHPGIQWTCLSRSGYIPPEVVGLMKSAGCRKVFFGLESGSNSVLRLMNKNTTVEEAERTVRLFAQCGIKAAGFFMVGYPGETLETIEDTFAWALSLPLEEISFTLPVPLPGTGLFRRVSGLRPDADWKYENENRMIYQSEFDEEFLRRRIAETQAVFDSRHKP